MAVETVAGGKVVIHFDGTRCVHSRNCVLGRPDVFVPNVEGAWIHPERASVTEIAILAHSCPSGAIQYECTDGSPGEAAPAVNLVRVRENGPLAFHAPLNVAGKEEGFRLTLCRCGESHNKPFCDGSHNAAHFAATGEPAAVESNALAARGGALCVDPVPNGPLHVTGNLEVVSGTGKTINRVTEAWLCRCGHSANKPYCDGTHAKVGFHTED